MKMTRKQAAQELHAAARGYGDHFAFSTVYRRCYHDKVHDTWRFSGRAHDYTV